MLIMHVVGARPNFMKIAPVMRHLATLPDQCSQLLVHTGQHYDEKMSDIFFEELDLPRPDVNLAVGSASHAVQTVCRESSERRPSPAPIYPFGREVQDRMPTE